MIYSRLMLARNLLSDDGVIFISIDDNEVDNLRKICDEIYGEMNFIAMATIIVKTEIIMYKLHKNIEKLYNVSIAVSWKNFPLEIFYIGRPAVM